MEILVGSWSRTFVFVAMNVLDGPDDSAFSARDRRSQRDIVQVNRFYRVFINIRVNYLILIVYISCSILLS